MRDREYFKAYFTGYVDVAEKDDYLIPYLFSPQMREYYKKKRDFFGSRSLFTSCIAIWVDKCRKVAFDFQSFDTNGHGVRFDVTGIGEETKHIAFDERKGYFELEVDCEDVQIWFPYDTELGIKNINIDGNIHFFEENVIYSFGDSITQGLHTIKPSTPYTAVLSRAYNTKAYNFGIAGFWYDKGILGDIDILPFPKLITISYGGNDWGNDKEDYMDEMSIIFGELARRYADIPVFVMLPFMGKMKSEGRKIDFHTMRDRIKEEALQYDNFRVMDCFMELDVDTMLYDDIHPNTLGMEVLGNSVLRAVKKVL